MTSMQALAFVETGGPEVLQCLEVSRPVPGPATVLIRNHVVGVNSVDTALRSGKVPLTAYAAPYIVGQEGAGVVAALGEGVTGLAVGERVLWMDLPSDAHGYAQYSVVRANNVVRIEDTVSFENAAAAPCVYSAARLQIGRYYGRAETGGWALIRNAAGAAGTAMVATATAAGLKVIAVTSAAKLAFARARGAVETIDREREGVAERVREITGSKGVALALNAVGGPTAVEDVGLLAPCGQLILYGLLSGLPAGDVWGAVMPRSSEGLTVSWSSIIAYMRQSPTGFRELLEGIAVDLGTGRLTPSIFEAIPLERGASAHALLAEKKNMGKVILTLGH